MQLTSPQGVLYLPTPEEEARLKNRWLIRLRSIAVMTQIAILLTAFSMNTIGRRQALLVLAVMVGVGAFNLYIVAANWIVDMVTDWHIFAQLSFDLLALVTMLALTKGLHNPFHSLLYLHLLLGALMLHGWFASAFAYLTGGSLMLLVLAVPRPVLWPETFFLLAPKLVVLIATFLIVSYLAAFVRGYRDHLAHIQRTRMQMDHLHGIGALTVGICHELFTPFNTISLKLARLRRAGGDAEDLDVAEGALQRCTRALKRLMDTKVNPEGLQLKPVSLHGTLCHVLDEWRENHPGIRVQFESQAIDGLAALPQALFANVILDLLDNAAEAMSTQGQASIDVDLACSQRFFQLRIMDRGPGWPDIVREQLGEPFLTTRSDGMGLGLYNACLLLRSIGGELRLVDREGAGAVALLSLPVWHKDSL